MTIQKRFLVLTLLALNLANLLPPAAFGTDGQDSPEKLRLKTEMRSLEQNFKSLETPLGKKPPDYDQIIALLDDMTSHANTIQELKSSGHPGKAFKRLFQDIEAFRKSAHAKNASGVEDNMNRLAENCFRCHLSHGDSDGTRSSRR